MVERLQTYWSVLLLEQKAEVLQSCIRILLQQCVHAGLASLQPQMPLQSLRQLCLLVHPPEQPQHYRECHACSTLNAFRHR